MNALVIGFLSCFISTMLIVRFQHLHQHFSFDHAQNGPQKFHINSVPRIGGIGLIIGLIISAIFRYKSNESNLEIPLLIASIPVFGVGLAEDITKSITVKYRLFFCTIGAGLFIYLFKVQIIHFDINLVDYIFQVPAFSIIISIFAITGLTNSYNLIDGFNGLSSMVGLIALLAIAYLGFQLQDSQVVYLALSMSSVILGFLIWNYPRGLIFLGDGGAYLIGFWIACLSIYMSHKYLTISPWFFFLINGYPIIETLFSIYRRKIHKGENPGHADGIHFHTLIFRRLLKRYHLKKSWIPANSRTAPFFWVLSLALCIPSLFLWKSTPCMLILSLAYFVFYIYIYKKIVRFQTPSWLKI